MQVLYFSVNDSSMHMLFFIYIFFFIIFKLKCHNRISQVKTLDFSVVMHAGLLQSFT